MKKLIPITLLSMVLTVAMMNAQPTITSANMYAVGDELILQPTDTLGITPGASGAAQTWDFTNLINSGSPVIQTWVLPSTTPYSSSFPTADLALNAGSGNYVFYDAIADDLFQLGFASSSITAPYSDAQQFLSFPFTYNSTFTDNLAASFEINGYDNDRSGTVTFLVDGYGTLMLPGTTYDDVLRIKYTQNVTDVLHFGPITLTTVTATTTYIWMKEGNKNALMDISYITASSSGNTINTKTVFYYPGATSAQDVTAVDPHLQLFPNPTADQAIIEVHLDQAGSLSLSILNNSGQAVKNFETQEVAAGLYIRSLDMRDLTPGIYFVRFDMNGRNLVTQPIVKQ